MNDPLRDVCFLRVFLNFCFLRVFYVRFFTCVSYECFLYLFFILRRCSSSLLKALDFRWKIVYGLLNCWLNSVECWLIKAYFALKMITPIISLTTNIDVTEMKMKPMSIQVQHLAARDDWGLSKNSQSRYCIRFNIDISP